MYTAYRYTRTFRDEQKALISRDRPSEGVDICILRTDTHGTFRDEALSSRDRSSEAVLDTCILRIGTRGRYSCGWRKSVQYARPTVGSSRYIYYAMF